jgi:hypothetical protein
MHPSWQILTHAPQPVHLLFSITTIISPVTVLAVQLLVPITHAAHAQTTVVPVNFDDGDRRENDDPY